MKGVALLLFINLVSAFRYIYLYDKWLSSICPDFYTEKSKVISSRLAENLKENGIKLSPISGNEITKD